MEAHTFGYLLAGVFFGISLLMLGRLILDSDRFPSWLAAVVFLAGVGYLIDSFGMMISPELESVYTGIVTATAVIGEFALTGWLLIKGVKERD